MLRTAGEAELRYLATPLKGNGFFLAAERRCHLAHGEPAVGRSGGEKAFEPRRGDVGWKRRLTSPPGSNGYSRGFLTHGWLAVG
jgi:hypothetical protein